MDYSLQTVTFKFFSNNGVCLLKTTWLIKEKDEITFIIIIISHYKHCKNM